MRLRNYILAAFALVAGACATAPQNSDPLPSWNDTPVKKQIIDYMEQQVPAIPVADRIAVFDMDGTIACERPMWFEMAVTINKLLDMQKADPSLKDRTEFEFARKLAANPEDSTVLGIWSTPEHNYLDSMILKSFNGMDSEEYIKYATDFLTNNEAPKYGKYADLFYQPMLELIDYLEAKEFEVYIVSGSNQDIVWSICPQVVGIGRDHLIGTRQKMTVSFAKDHGTEPKFTIQNDIFRPKNNYFGKALNIYDHIGKIPVVAIGNTTGDFGMFHMASSSKYPNLSLMLNHDDAEREYAYNPFYGNHVPVWRDSLKMYNWIQADMSKEFKTVWKK